MSAWRRKDHGESRAPRDAELLDGLERAAVRAGLSTLDALAIEVVARDVLAILRDVPHRARCSVGEQGGMPAVGVAIEAQIDPERCEAIERAMLRYPSRVEAAVETEGSMARLTMTAARRARTAAAPRGTGDPYARAAAALDEIELQRAELARLREELEESNRGVVALYAERGDRSRTARERSELLDTLAHELRDPLAALKLAAEDLAQASSSERTREVMERQLEQLRRMVDDLLDVSRITRGEVGIERTPIDLVGAVRSAVEPRVALAREGGHTVELRLPRAPVYVEGDAARIEQVVVNLLDNAMKYTPPPGRITVTIGVADAEAEIRVRDTGRGMTAEQAHDAFEPFVRHADRHARPTGLGIGLTLAREIVLLHSGSIDAESEGLGRGTTFHVRLPLTTRAPDPPEEAPREAASARAMRLLLVEDNEDFRELLAARLRRRGFEVEEIGDGDAALERLRRGELPDAVVTDVGLPGMDGYALARALRSDPRARGIKLVALTGYSGPGTAASTSEAGFDAHLVKPVALEELLRALGA